MRFLFECLFEQFDGFRVTALHVIAPAQTTVNSYLGWCEPSTDLILSAAFDRVSPKTKHEAVPRVAQFVVGVGFDRLQDASLGLQIIPLVPIDDCLRAVSRGQIGSQCHQLARDCAHFLACRRWERGNRLAQTKLQQTHPWPDKILVQLDGSVKIRVGFWKGGIVIAANDEHRLGAKSGRIFIF